MFRKMDFIEADKGSANASASLRRPRGG
eukprot:COSAG06_NODE_25788_length_628_cov_8.655955_2_plen_27_part_01